MKRLILWGILPLLAACAPFEEAYYIEREFGKDSQAAWDAQIVNKDGRYRDRVPEGMSGITAEEVMNVRNQTFAEKPRKTQVFEIGMGGSN
jgi:hypothetical protein